jgi:hypothetical protein
MASSTVVHETIESGPATGVVGITAGICAGQTNHPSENETGLDASHHTRISPRGGEKSFFLTSSFIG